MADIAPLDEDTLQNISGRAGFDAASIAKDFQETVLLYLLRNVEGLHFKGGTALQKMFLDYTRLSEDLDFTVATPLSEVRHIILGILKESGRFSDVGKDKDVEGFLRMVVHYESPPGYKGNVFIDLNSRAKLILAPRKMNVPHFYAGRIPEFAISTLDLRELVAEKVAAAIGRNQPRDHFDIYQIIRYKLPIDMKLVQQKCKASGNEFNIVKMFNNARKLKNRWDEDLLPLVREEVQFEMVMKALAKRFDLAGEKKLMRNVKAKVH